MGGEHHYCAVRDGVELVDEHRTAGLQIGYHVQVVHYLFPYVDRPTPVVQQLLHDCDGALDPAQNDRGAASRTVRAIGGASAQGSVVTMSG